MEFSANGQHFRISFQHQTIESPLQQTTLCKIEYGEGMSVVATSERIRREGKTRRVSFTIHNDGHRACGTYTFTVPLSSRTVQGSKSTGRKKALAEAVALLYPFPETPHIAARQAVKSKRAVFWNAYFETRKEKLRRTYQEQYAKEQIPVLIDETMGTTINRLMTGKEWKV